MCVNIRSERGGVIRFVMAGGKLSVIIPGSVAGGAAQ